MATSQQKAGGGQRKYGRHDRSPSGKRYTTNGHRDKNKARRLLSYMKKFPNYKSSNQRDGVIIILNRVKRT
ncbi:hypothetical protein LCGC14_2430120 [marine sediment metagenome]|uniref:Uncharacterized protein n=1 Tax=marine sediment metagenome TaxID=412755 RepID=A0A0F9DZ74_9ZZZZ